MRSSRTAYNIDQAFGQLESRYDSCFSVGIMGGCGVDCPIYQRGECEIEEEISKE